MIFSLIKKDFLIIKKYVLIMLGAAIIIPLFILWRVPVYAAGELGFMLSVIFCVLLLLQYVLLKEYQFPKAATLLCAAPFSRKMMVLSRYIFCMIIYVACCVIFAVEALFIPDLATVDVTLFFIMLFATALFIGIYLPLQYKLGYEKTKFIFTVVVMASPFILPQLMKTEGVNMNFLSALSPVLVCGIVLLLSCIILIVSAVLSMKFYTETELA